MRQILVNGSLYFSDTMLESCRRIAIDRDGRRDFEDLMLPVCQSAYNPHQHLRVGTLRYSDHARQQKGLLPKKIHLDGTYTVSRIE